MRDRPPTQTHTQQLLPADHVVLTTTDPRDRPLHLTHNLPTDPPPPWPWQILQPPHARDATASDAPRHWQVLQLLAGPRRPVSARKTTPRPTATELERTFDGSGGVRAQ